MAKTKKGEKNKEEEKKKAMGWRSMNIEKMGIVENQIVVYLPCAVNVLMAAACRRNVSCTNCLN